MLLLIATPLTLTLTFLPTFAYSMVRLAVLVHSQPNLAEIVAPSPSG